MGLPVRLVSLDPGALLTDEDRDHLELGAHRRPDGPALDGRLDLAHGAGEHGDHPFVVTHASALA